MFRTRSIRIKDTMAVWISYVGISLIQIYWVLLVAIKQLKYGMYGTRNVPILFWPKVISISIYVIILNCKKIIIFSVSGENINITWSPDGHTIAVGNKEDLITFIDMRTLKSISEQQFNFEVNEMSWNNESDLFFLTNGLGCVYVLR